MIDHRRAVLALFVVAALIVGTAGYDSVQSERSADVNVATDADAYLALEPTGTTIENESTGPVLKLTNQFGTSVDVSITDLSTNGGVAVQGLTDTSLGTGDATSLEVTCTTANDGTVTVDIEATGDGIAFETTETVAVSCEGASTTTTTTTTA
jgi:hypothetical protein